MTISGGALPGALGGAVETSDADTDADTAADTGTDTNADPAEPEPSYSRRGKNRRHERDGVTEPEAETTNTEENPYTTTNFESEGMNHEEQ